MLIAQPAQSQWDEMSEGQRGRDYNEVYLYSKMSIYVILSEGQWAMVDILVW